MLFSFFYLIQGRGNKSSGDNFHAAPNIDHSQDFVRKDIKEWLCWLRSLLWMKFFCSRDVFDLLSFFYYQWKQNCMCRSKTEPIF